MPKKRFSAERIVTLLRQIEVSMTQRNATPVACRDAGICLLHGRRPSAVILGPGQRPRLLPKVMRIGPLTND